MYKNFIKNMDKFYYNYSWNIFVTLTFTRCHSLTAHMEKHSLLPTIAEKLVHHEYIVRWV